MDLSNIHWIILIGTTLMAAVAQSAIGFGFAVIAVPVFLLVLPVQDAIQLAMVLSLGITVAMIVVVYNDLPWITIKNLLIGSVIGFPVGYLVFTIATPTIIKLIVAISIAVALAGSSIKKHFSSDLQQTRLNAIIAGIVSGTMVTSIGMAGPAIAIYMLAIGARKAETRAAIFGVFLVSYSVAIILHQQMHGFSGLALNMSLYLLPVLLLGTYIGHILAGKISEKAFQRLIFATLSIVAACLVYSVI